MGFQPQRVEFFQTVVREAGGPFDSGSCGRVIVQQLPLDEGRPRQEIGGARVVVDALVVELDGLTRPAEVEHQPLAAQRVGVDVVGV